MVYLLGKEFSTSVYLDIRRVLHVGYEMLQRLEPACSMTEFFRVRDLDFVLESSERLETPSAPLSIVI